VIANAVAAAPVTIDITALKQALAAVYPWQTNFLPWKKALQMVMQRLQKHLES
jgi:hypothetical protein